MLLVQQNFWKCLLLPAQRSHLKQKQIDRDLYLISATGLHCKKSCLSFITRRIDRARCLLSRYFQFLLQKYFIPKFAVGASHIFDSIAAQVFHWNNSIFMNQDIKPGKIV